MKISKIKISNYRSIESIDIDVAKLSIFVGQNNHGKTNIFEAIDWFYSSAKSTSLDEKFMRDDSKQINVELFFDDVLESDIEKLKEDTSKTKIRTLLGDNKSFSISKNSGTHKKNYIVNGEDKGNPQGLDTAILEFIPKLEYVNTTIRLDDVSKYKDKNPIGMMLSGVLTAIIETSQDYLDFKAQFKKLFEDSDSEVRQALDKLGLGVEVYLQKQFPDGTTIKFGVNPPALSDLLKSFDTTVNDGIETRAEEKGDGMQRAVMLAIIQAFADYRKEQLGGGTFLFLIDEAELHLHPSAQRLLKNALIDISKTDQAIVNTHSSVFVVDNHENQKIFKVVKEDRITNAIEIDDNGKIDVIFDLLGGSPADLLLPKNFVVVEGKSDYIFISEIIKRFYATEFRGIKVLFSGGDVVKQEGSISAIDILFRPIVGSDNPIYKDKVVVLLDKPNTAQLTTYNLFKTGYPYLFDENRVFELDQFSIEEYYPASWKKTAAETSAMGIAQNEKVAYARKVASEISKDEFERGMKIIYDMLLKALEKSFKTT